MLQLMFYLQRLHTLRLENQIFIQLDNIKIIVILKIRNKIGYLF